MRRRLGERIGRAVPGVLSGLVVLGIALRGGVRDRWPGVDTLYYATPLPLVALAGLLAAWLYARRRSRRRAALALLTAGVVAVCHVFGSYHTGGSTAVPADALRVVLWNVSGEWPHWSSLPDRLAEFDADLICLVEAEGLEAEREALARALPDHAIRFVEGGFALLSRLGPERVIKLELSVAKAIRIDLDPPDADPAVVLLVDVPSNPLRSRGPAIRELRRQAERLAGTPTLLLGDFNTPRRSFHFDRLRASFVHAFEAAGEGFVETWPSLAPVLDLDHVWCGRGWTPGRCRLEFGWASDHLAVVADLVLRTP